MPVFIHAFVYSPGICGLPNKVQALNYNVLKLQSEQNIPFTPMKLNSWQGGNVLRQRVKRVILSKS